MLGTCKPYVAPATPLPDYPIFACDLAISSIVNVQRKFLKANLQTQRD